MPMVEVSNGGTDVAKIHITCLGNQWGTVNSTVTVYDQNNNVIFSSGTIGWTYSRGSNTGASGYYDINITDPISISGKGGGAY